MLVLLLQVLAGTATASETPPASEDGGWPAMAAVLAVFDDVPERRRRKKVVRYVMRKDDTVRGGRDWGRVLCFEFTGDQNAELVQAAIDRSGITGTARDAESCASPPKEAFLPPKARARRVVHFGNTDMALVRSEFGALLDLDLDLTAVRVQPGVSDRVCLEFSREPDDDALTFALKALEIDVEGTEPSDDCVTALSTE